MNAMTNMPVRIERGIPIPAGRGKGRFPFAEMEIGDSFLSTARQENIRSSAVYFRRTAPHFRVSVRKEGNGYRCWRVA